MSTTYYDQQELTTESLKRILIKRYYPISPEATAITLLLHEQDFLGASLNELLQANYRSLHPGKTLPTHDLQTALDETDLVATIQEIVTAQYNALHNPQLQKILQLCDVVRVFETSKTQYTVNQHNITAYSEVVGLAPEKPLLYEFQSMIKKYECNLLLTERQLRNNELDLLVRYFETLILRSQQTVHMAILRAIVRSRAKYKTINAQNQQCADTMRAVFTTFSEAVDADYMPLNLSPEFLLAPINLQVFYNKFINISQIPDRTQMHYLMTSEDEIAALYDNSLLSITREFFGKQATLDAYFLTKNSVILEAFEGQLMPKISYKLTDNGDLVLTAQMYLGVHVPESQTIIRVQHQAQNS